MKLIINSIVAYCLLLFAGFYMFKNVDYSQVEIHPYTLNGFGFAGFVTGVTLFFVLLLCYSVTRILKKKKHELLQLSRL